MSKSSRKPILFRLLIRKLGLAPKLERVDKEKGEEEGKEKAELYISIEVKTTEIL